VKILVTGGAGMLGSSLVPALAGAGHDVVATDIDLSDPRPWAARGPRLQWLDVRHRVEVKDCFASVRPHLVVHLAAETSLEISDRDPDHAYLTNTVATKYVALQARAAGVPMVYVSTADVFDGTKNSAYTEFDRPNPINTHGASKYDGELIVAGLVEEHYIVRAGWMVGGGAAKDHKFVSRIVNQLQDGARTVYAVTDKVGSPTYAPEFSRCLIGLLGTGLLGVYHMTCGGGASRYDIADRILRALGRTDVELVGVGSDYFADEFFSIRPESQVMRNMVLDLQGMNTMPDWRDAIDDYLRTEFAAHATHGAGVALSL
jgi:dTDP-4-dehydrorhamnose reductase